MYQRILVPVDGSETSGRALATAVRMARESGPAARIRVVHVTEMASWACGYETYGDGMEQVLAIMRDNARKILDEAMEVARAEGVVADQQLVDQFGERMGVAVATAAKLWNADVVVVGTHGRRGVDRLLLGSGAEEVIRQSPVPVLVVRGPGSHPPTLVDASTASNDKSISPRALKTAG